MTMDEFRKMRGMIEPEKKVEPEKKQEQPRRGRKPKESVDEQVIVSGEPVQEEPAGE